MDAFAEGWGGGIAGRAAGWSRAGRPLIVAVPVRDEAARIVACLERLSAQHVADVDVGVLLLINNCRDATAAMVRSVLPRMRWPLETITVELPAERAHAGWARRLAMDAAASRLERTGRDDGLILTTDADSRVGDRWLAANLAAMRGGAEAVAGDLLPDAAEEAALPAALRRRAHLERCYAKLAAELDARLDPLAHDPWPRHRTASGASLAVTLRAYRAVGGMPAVQLGEDRAFVDLLARRDIAVRHSPEVLVTTSRRLVGRASGGMADTIRRQAAAPDLPCDPMLETVAATRWRARCRAWIRALAAQGRLAEVTLWAPVLGMARGAASAAVATPWVGEAWSRIEAGSASLRRRPLLPAALPGEIACATRRLAELDAGRAPADLASGDAGRRSDRTVAAAA